MIIALGGDEPDSGAGESKGCDERETYLPKTIHVVLLSLLLLWSRTRIRRETPRSRFGNVTAIAGPERGFRAFGWAAYYTFYVIEAPPRAEPGGSKP